MKKTFCDRCSKEGMVYDYEARQFCKECFKEVEDIKQELINRWRSVLNEKK